MAKSTLVVILDDLDGKPDAETHEFAVGAEKYTIDLTVTNAKALNKALATAKRIEDKATEEIASLMDMYVKAATPVKPTPHQPKGRGKGSNRPTRPDRDQAKAIREWAARKGYNVAPRGRIRADIVEEYNREAGR